MGIDDRLVADIVSRVVAVAAPRRIVIFGSAAAGRLTKDSDIDLLIVRDEVADARAERVKIRQALRGLGWAFDVVLMATARFEETKHVIGGVAYPASKHGRVIYEVA